MFAEFDDLFERAWFYVGEVDLLLYPSVLDHIFKKLRFLGDCFIDLEFSLVRGNEGDFTHLIIDYQRIKKLIVQIRHIILVTYLPSCWEDCWYIYRTCLRFRWYSRLRKRRRGCDGRGHLDLRPAYEGVRMILRGFSWGILVYFCFLLVLRWSGVYYRADRRHRSDLSLGYNHLDLLQQQLPFSKPIDEQRCELCTRRHRASSMVLQSSSSFLHKHYVHEY